MATLPYWNNGEVISSDKLNSMVQAIINGDPLAVKVSNATKNDVNQIISYLSSLYNSAKTNLNSATSTNDFDTAYTNMTALVSNKLGSYANDDTVDLYSTGIRASIITFLQAYDNMMSKDRLNNKNVDNTLKGQIDNTNTKLDQTVTNINDKVSGINSKIDTANNKINDLTSNGGGRNLVSGTGLEYAMGSGIPTTTWQDGYAYLKLPTTLTYSNVEVLPQNPHTFFYTLTQGTTYTQTVWFETDATIKDLSVAQITWFTRGNGHDWQPATLIKLGENKYKLYSTYMWVGKSDNNVRLFDTHNLDGAFDLSTGTYLKFGKLMLEKGIVSHDWSPNPNEIQSSLDSLNANKLSSADAKWDLIATNSKNAYNYASGSIITFPNNSSITLKNDRIIPHINLPVYLTDNLWNTDLNNLATSGEYDSAFIPSATMATLTNRPTNPDTNAPLTGDCFFTGHYAYSGTTLRAFQKIYSCDYNYVFIRSYNGSSGAWTNWSCLTPYA